MTKLILSLILSLTGVVSVVSFSPPSWGGYGGGRGPGH